MNPIYTEFHESDLDLLIHFYQDCYNADGGTWTYETAYKRIHQITSMEHSRVLLQFDQNHLVGFLMGYFKFFDDSTGFYLEELLISPDFQHKGYGSHFIQHLNSDLAGKGCDWIELLTTTKPLHQNFYSKNGYRPAEHLITEFLDLN